MHLQNIALFSAALEEHPLIISGNAKARFSHSLSQSSQNQSGIKSI